MTVTNAKRQERGRVGMGDALFPRTRKTILGLLFGQPERSYTISELIRLAGAGRGAVQREVERLTSSGLLTVNVVGRQKQYRANAASPIHGEMLALVKKTLGPAERLRAALKRREDEIELAILYGSVAKGTDRADSDIDVLLVSPTLTLEDAFGLLTPVENELGRTINPTLYTPDEYRRRRNDGNSFLQRILAGKHVVLKGGTDGSVTT